MTERSVCSVQCSVVWPFSNGFSTRRTRSLAFGAFGSRSVFVRLFAFGAFGSRSVQRSANEQVPNGPNIYRTGHRLDNFLALSTYLRCLSLSSRTQFVRFSSPLFARLLIIVDTLRVTNVTLTKAVMVWYNKLGRGRSTPNNQKGDDIVTTLQTLAPVITAPSWQQALARIPRLADGTIHPDYRELAKRILADVAARSAYSPSDFVDDTEEED